MRDGGAGAGMNQNQFLSDREILIHDSYLGMMIGMSEISIELQQNQGKILEE